MSGGGGGSDKVKDTPEQRYAAQVAAEKWNYAQTKLAPLEDEYMARVDDMDSAGRMSYLRGATNQSMMAGLGQANDQVSQQLGAAGINPNSGRWQGTLGDVTEQSAAAGGETMGRAQFQQSQEQIRGLQNITAIGAGESGQAQAGLNQIARTSAADARNSASNAFNRRSANLQLLGNLAGAGTSHYMGGGNFGGITGGGSSGAAQAGNFGLSGFDNGFGLSGNAVSGLKYGG